MTHEKIKERVIAKLSELEERSDWEFYAYENHPLSSQGYGIQLAVLDFLGIKPSFSDLMDLWNPETQVFEIPEARDIIVKEGLWLGLEGGVDTAILYITLDSGDSFTFEGAVARPVTVYYTGEDPIEALKCFENHIPNEL